MTSPEPRTTPETPEQFAERCLPTGFYPQYYYIHVRAAIAKMVRERDSLASAIGAGGDADRAVIVERVARHLHDAEIGDNGVPPWDELIADIKANEGKWSATYCLVKVVNPTRDRAAELVRIVLSAAEGERR